ncbi:hypothetical protein [Shewanella violacea]|uniref:Uncharacterized protein n=1 Tax=Shewanella violacea (strain JCM 10179 / CIP 106290 / LMG 19151 / DSS12) TaxID=637905 RepID=D4ZIM8_SHEVD|nr:hypothetical protein [Shewanella violacea]BAJ01527.1 hypothetical protein SVI_1556 [Shewanella violacea DSS12]
MHTLNLLILPPEYSADDTYQSNAADKQTWVKLTRFPFDKILQAITPANVIVQVRKSLYANPLLLSTSPTADDTCQGNKSGKQAYTHILLAMINTKLIILGVWR